ncbi:putative molybdenum carrier protein [Vulcaniibacterium tengchongense]|uniref:Putative molybdenum carrier protein n=2 Tax=Vulcaniibacterium tengchongense TaxID=1273429 RepID=A0A3N4VEQ1_9GAMM|nr:putative molybdenum carrier protein [Vulcaniibacterium tengchongense]
MTRIASGGQTGVDRAALDAALATGIPHGGWCPKGRLAADGPLHPRYLLQETDSAGYRQRTRRNVLDSDGTLILNTGPLGGGTQLTLRFAGQFRKPVCIVDLERPLSPEEVLAWIDANRIKVLNVAGPGEAKRPGIYAQARTYLDRLLALWALLDQAGNRPNSAADPA